MQSAASGFDKTLVIRRTVNWGNVCFFFDLKGKLRVCVFVCMLIVWDEGGGKGQIAG